MSPASSPGLCTRHGEGPLTHNGPAVRRHGLAHMPVHAVQHSDGVMHFSQMCARRITSVTQDSATQNVQRTWRVCTDIAVINLTRLKGGDVHELQQLNELGQRCPDLLRHRRPLPLVPSVQLMPAMSRGQRALHQPSATTFLTIRVTSQQVSIQKGHASLYRWLAS